VDASRQLKKCSNRSILAGLAIEGLDRYMLCRGNPGCVLKNLPNLDIYLPEDRQRDRLTIALECQNWCANPGADRLRD